MTFNIPTLGPGEQVLEFGGGDGQPVVSQGAFVARVADPNIIPQPYAQPADFAGQYPLLLDPTETIAMCEEVTLWSALPEETTALNGVMWRELNVLAFTSGSSAVSFADGECPSEYTADGTATTVNHKNIGAKKSLSQRDIMHSNALAAMPMGAINQLVGGHAAGEGVPGGTDLGTFVQENVADAKEKELRKAQTLTLNGWDRLLAVGNAGSNSLEFSGIETEVTSGNGSHTNTSSPSGTFAAATYDRFLGYEPYLCVKVK